MKIIPPVKSKYPKMVGPTNPPRLASVLTAAIPTAACFSLNHKDNIAKNGPVKLYNPIDANVIRATAAKGLLTNPVPANPIAAKIIGRMTYIFLSNFRSESLPQITMEGIAAKGRYHRNQIQLLYWIIVLKNYR